MVWLSLCGGRKPRRIGRQALDVTYDLAWTSYSIVCILIEIPCRRNETAVILLEWRYLKEDTSHLMSAELFVYRASIETGKQHDLLQGCSLRSRVALRIRENLCKSDRV